jgi:pimeloyl-ACP methyl ester carboxylesterase
MGDTHELRLPDGRLMTYSDHGTGTVVLDCVGTPGTRLLHPDLLALLETAGVRMLTPDRPGFGGSDPQPGRTLTDWPADAAALLDALGLDRVAVRGGSGGGPYAVACGVALADRVDRVALMCPGTPADAPVHGTVVPRGRDALRERGEWLAALVRDEPEAFLALVTAPDEPPDPARREWALAMFGAAFAQGTDAYVEDHLINDSHWSGLLPRLTRPTRIWHGALDDNIPLAAVRWMADRIPGAELVALPEAGHDVFAATPDVCAWLRGSTR